MNRPGENSSMRVPIFGREMPFRNIVFFNGDRTFWIIGYDVSKWHFTVKNINLLEYICSSSSFRSTIFIWDACRFSYFAFSSRSWTSFFLISSSDFFLSKFDRAIPKFFDPLAELDKTEFRFRGVDSVLKRWRSISSRDWLRRLSSWIVEAVRSWYRNPLSF